MGQLEIQDGFTPYFDDRKEIEVKVADRKPARHDRVKAVRPATAIVRKPEPASGPAKPHSGSHQMK